MAEITVTTRTREQGKRLRKLREGRKFPKPLLCSRLGFGSTQTYDLYERGVSVIRVDRVGDWAEAFEMSREDFIESVLGAGDPSADGWTFRGALHGQIPDWLIEQLAPEWEGKPLINQKAAAAGILQMAEEQRSSATKSSRKDTAI